ncbi:hypothetical protein FNV43_RR03244 [Rhamnella rubrinervis]|uniref:NAC domain-containing protein n=1 Tax=Rhamnella rubrinervis TaxID=2594499 RepID=A0A8K0MNI3_9ROSA|nr:hypothetical protein FNV43_RR03244 [Rhamnella rubrinervis]
MEEHQNRDVTYNSPIKLTKPDDAVDPASKYPPGYRFFPTDEELVGYYLRKRVANEELPINMRTDVQLYKYNPEYLAENFKPQGDIHWYFFTPRDRKYPNGVRPNRAAGDGYWKATGADKEVHSENGKIGSKKALVFYRGKPQKGVKTDWIMHEYRSDDSPKRKKGANDMRLDDWVLCKVYKKANRNMKSKSEEDEHVVSAEKTTGEETLIPSEPIQNHNIDYVNVSDYPVHHFQSNVNMSDYPVHHFQSNHLLLEPTSTNDFHQHNQLGFGIDVKTEDQFDSNLYQFGYPTTPGDYSNYLLDDDTAFEQWENVNYFS